MTLIEILQYNLVETNWSTITAGKWVYIIFNLLEGIAWLAIGGYVLRRGLAHCLIRDEIIYFATFVLFGITDFCEMHFMPVWLLAAKGIILTAILVYRKKVLTKYPGLKF